MPRRPNILLAALAGLTLGTAVAQAQLPNLRRKAKEAATQAVTGQQVQQRNGEPLKFDNTVLELNAQVVARLIKGLDARSKIKGPGGRTAAQLRENAQVVTDAAHQIHDEHGNERFEFTNKKHEALSCVSEQLGNMNNVHQQELQRRVMGLAGVNTPDKMKFMQDYMALTQELSTAMQSNDTSGMRIAQEKINKFMGVDAKADTARAYAACHVPPTPAWITREDSLLALSGALLDTARSVEVMGSDAGSHAAEMTPEQFAMAAERAGGFVAVASSSGGVGGFTLYVFTKVEETALQARLAELKKYLG